MTKTAVIRCRKVVARKGLLNFGTRYIHHSHSPIVLSSYDDDDLALHVRIANYQRPPGYDLIPVYGSPLELAKLYSRRTIRTFW